MNEYMCSVRHLGMDNAVLGSCGRAAWRREAQHGTSVMCAHDSCVSYPTWSMLASRASLGVAPREPPSPWLRALFRPRALLCPLDSAGGDRETGWGGRSAHGAKTVLRF
jgi:hypothetical protein